MEALELSFYMFCACAFAILLQHPASPVRHWIGSAALRRVLMGLATGATVIAIVMTRQSARPSVQLLRAQSRNCRNTKPQRALNRDDKNCVTIPKPFAPPQRSAFVRRTRPIRPVFGEHRGTL